MYDCLDIEISAGIVDRERVFEICFPNKINFHIILKNQ